MQYINATVVGWLQSNGITLGRGPESMEVRRVVVVILFITYYHNFIYFFTFFAAILASFSFFASSLSCAILVKLSLGVHGLSHLVL